MPHSQGQCFGIDTLAYDCANFQARYLDFSNQPAIYEGRAFAIENWNGRRGLGWAEQALPKSGNRPGLPAKILTQFVVLEALVNLFMDERIAHPTETRKSNQQANHFRPENATRRYSARSSVTPFAFQPYPQHHCGFPDLGRSSASVC
jgi:hypothetical protein